VAEACFRRERLPASIHHEGLHPFAAASTCGKPLSEAVGFLDLILVKPKDAIGGHS
jgi:hypothetical protein